MTDLKALDQKARDAKKAAASLEARYQTAQARADAIGDEMQAAQQAADDAARAYHLAALADLPVSTVEVPQKLGLAQ